MMRFPGVLLALALGACAAPRPSPVLHGATLTKGLASRLDPAAPETRSMSVDFRGNGGLVTIAVESSSPGAELEVTVSPRNEETVIAKGKPPLSLPNLGTGHYDLVVELRNDVATEAKLEIVALPPAP